MTIKRAWLTALAGIWLAGFLRGEALQQGLYMKIPMPSSDTEAQRDYDILHSNPYLDGVLTTAKWKDIEPKRDQYDFSAIDRAIAAVRKSGKHYKIAIVPA